MSHTQTPVGPEGGIGHTADPPNDQGSAPEVSAPVRPSEASTQRHRVRSLVVGCIVCVLAVVMLAGSGWAFWMDRFDRDASGFVSIGTTREFQTETYGIVSDLRGDIPGWVASWLYGSQVMGTARARVTPLTDKPVFVGIARSDDVSRYLAGTEYATIESWSTGALATHSGAAPSDPPARASIWVASTQGTGEQTLLWKPRAFGDWNVVVMNADASAGVGARGRVAAEVPMLPWFAGGLLVAAALFAFIGLRVVLPAVRRDHPERT